MMDVLKWFEETSSDDNRWNHVTTYGTLQLLSPNNKVCHSNKHHHCNDTVTYLNLDPNADQVKSSEVSLSFGHKAGHRFGVRIFLKLNPRNS